LAAALEGRLGNLTRRSLDLLYEAVTVAANFGDRPMVFGTCVHASEVLHALGLDDAAAVLIGITTTGPLAAFSIIITPTAVTERVGDSLHPAAYADALAKGAAMSYQQVIEFQKETLESLLADLEDVDA